MKKRIVSLLLVICMSLSLLPMTAFAAITNHPYANHHKAEKGWQAFSTLTGQGGGKLANASDSEASLNLHHLTYDAYVQGLREGQILATGSDIGFTITEGGSYYLGADTDLYAEAHWIIDLANAKNKTLTLCLNGKDLHVTTLGFAGSGEESAIEIKSGTLVIDDCCDQEQYAGEMINPGQNGFDGISGSKRAKDKKGSYTVLLNPESSYIAGAEDDWVSLYTCGGRIYGDTGNRVRLIKVADKSNLVLNNGTLFGGQLWVPDESGDLLGGNVLVEGTFTMNGGTIRNGSIGRANAGKRMGGDVYVAKNAVFALNGGRILSNQVFGRADGGSESVNSAYCAEQGGHVAVLGTMTMSGDACIAFGQRSINGSNVYVGEGGKLTMSENAVVAFGTCTERDSDGAAMHGVELFLAEGAEATMRDHASVFGHIVSGDGTHCYTVANYGTLHLEGNVRIGDTTGWNGIGNRGTVTTKNLTKDPNLNGASVIFLSETVGSTDLRQIRALYREQGAYGYVTDSLLASLTDLQKTPDFGTVTDLSDKRKATATLNCIGTSPLYHNVQLAWEEKKLSAVPNTEADWSELSFELNSEPLQAGKGNYNFEAKLNGIRKQDLEPFIELAAIIWDNVFGGGTVVGQNYDFYGIDAVLEQFAPNAQSRDTINRLVTGGKLLLTREGKSKLSNALKKLPAQTVKNVKLPTGDTLLDGILEITVDADGLAVELLDLLTWEVQMSDAADAGSLVVRMNDLADAVDTLLPKLSAINQTIDTVLELSESVVTAPYLSEIFSLAESGSIDPNGTAYQMLVKVNQILSDLTSYFAAMEDTDTLVADVMGWLQLPEPEASRIESILQWIGDQFRDAYPGMSRLVKGAEGDVHTCILEPNLLVAAHTPGIYELGFSAAYKDAVADNLEAHTDWLNGTNGYRETDAADVQEVADYLRGLEAMTIGDLVYVADKVWNNPRAFDGVCRSAASAANQYQTWYFDADGQPDGWDLGQFKVLLGLLDYKLADDPIQISPLVVLPDETAKPECLETTIRDSSTGTYTLAVPATSDQMKITLYVDGKAVTPTVYATRASQGETLCSACVDLYQGQGTVGSKHTAYYTARYNGKVYTGGTLTFKINETCKIYGTVEYQTRPMNRSLGGTELRLLQNGKPVAAVYADVMTGAYSIPNVAPGIYNLVLYDAGKFGKSHTQTVLIEADRADIKQDFLLTDVYVNSQVLVAAADTPQVTVGGLNALAAQYSAEAGDSNRTVILQVKAEKANADAIAEDVKTLMARFTELKNSVAKGQTTVDFINVQLGYCDDPTAGGFGYDFDAAMKAGRLTPIASVSDLLTLYVPYDMSSSKTNFRLYRVHEGVPELMKENPAAGEEGVRFDPANNRFVICAKNFSTYAVAFDRKTAKPSPAYILPIVTLPAYATCLRDENCPNAAFTDINMAEWYHDSIHYCLDAGVLQGNDDGTFEPETPASRGQVMQAIWNLAGNPQSTVQGQFRDVPDSKWCATPVNWAAANGLVTGFEKDEFGPDQEISREELVVIFYRYANKLGLDTTARAAIDAFPDVKRVDAYAREPMQWAVATELIRGSDRKLKPNEGATRSELAAVLMRFSRMLEEAGIR